MGTASAGIPGDHRQGIPHLIRKRLRKNPPSLRRGIYGREVLPEAQSQAQRKAVGSNPAPPSIDRQRVETSYFLFSSDSRKDGPPENTGGYTGQRSVALTSSQRQETPVRFRSALPPGLAYPRNLSVVTVWKDRRPMTAGKDRQHGEQAQVRRVRSHSGMVSGNPARRFDSAILHQQRGRIAA